MILYCIDSAVELSDCRNYLLLSIAEDCKPVNRVYYYDLRNLDPDKGVTGMTAQTQHRFIAH